MSDPLDPSVTLLMKLGSAIVHADEALFEVQRGGIGAALQFDIPAFRSAADDPEVVEWLEAMRKMAMLPVRR